MSTSTTKIEIEALAEKISDNWLYYWSNEELILFQKELSTYGLKIHASLLKC